MIYLDDSASESFKGIEPIIIRTSGLGVNTAMLDEYRAEHGPRPREGLDLLASLRKGRSQSTKYSKQATGSPITAGCDPRPTILSDADVPKEPEDWNSQAHDDLGQNYMHFDAREDKDMMEKDLSLV